MFQLFKLPRGKNQPPPELPVTSAQAPILPLLVNSGDAPIVESGDDVLGRVDFAAALAYSLVSYRSDSSFVISVNGKWGSGKTSLMNMCREFLARQKSPPTVIEINGWDWADSTSIGTVLLEKMESTLGRADSASQRKFGQLLHLYSLESKEKTLYAKNAYDLLFFSASVTMILMGWLKTTPEPWLISLFGFLLFVVSGYNLFFKFLGEHFDAAAKVQLAIADFLNASISARKREITGLLRDLTSPILVVVDDIDRLDAEEIRELLRIIKTNLNFPNLVFILLCDEDQLARAMSNSSGATSEGRKYLEKIIQLSIRVPAIEEGTLPRIFTSKLEKLLESYDLLPDFDWDRWKEIRDKNVYPLFKNMRDIVRFFNSYNFVLSRIVEKTDTTVDCLDVLCMELINTFEPDAWEKISSYRLIFTYMYDQREYSFVTEGEAAATLNEVFPLCHTHRDTVYQIIKEVFPNLAGYFGETRPNSSARQTWFNLKRICHPRIFERYFLRRANSGDVLHSDLYDLYSALRKGDLFISELRKFIRQGRFSTLLNRIIVFDCLPFDNDSEQEEAVFFLVALTSCFDEIYDIRTDDTGGIDLKAIDYDLDIAIPESLAYKIVCNCLSIFPLARRREILELIFTQTSGILLPCEILAGFIEDLEKGKSETPLVDSETIEVLKAITKLKLEQCSSIGTLIKHPRCSNLLLYWFELDSDGLRKWLLANLRDETSRDRTLDIFCNKEILKKSHLRKFDKRRLWQFLTNDELKEFGLPEKIGKVDEDSDSDYREIKGLKLR